jgi:shikimate dehydrogenase
MLCIARPSAAASPSRSRPRSPTVTDVLFVGVTTTGSLVHRAMPLWQRLLPSPVRVRGFDLEVGAAYSAYAALLDDIRGDPDVAGAVVTAHKTGLFAAARDQFDHLDPIAIACEEVNAVRHDGASLQGYARDPVSVGRVVEEIWPDRAGEVVCIGAGGTALALAFHLVAGPEPVRVACADRDPAALERLERLMPSAVAGHLGEGPWDDLVAEAPPGSLIVNATGMGKDRPGAPTSDRVRFPRDAVVWELNYRGDLRFLRLAGAQAQTAGLRVHDGWTLFCHGWAAALAPVLGLDDDPHLGNRFADAAADLKPSPDR